MWASYSKHGWTFAAEYNHVEDWGGNDNSGDGWLVMANYEFNSKFALTLRTSALEGENGVNMSLTDTEKWTISPSYKVSDDLLIVFEYSDLANNNNSALDTQMLAVETIVTF